MKDTLRSKFWEWIVSIAKCKEGRLLPKWLLYIRFCLFPFQAIYWHMNNHTGYDWYSDLWSISGRKYPGKFFRDIHENQNKSYRILHNKAGFAQIQVTYYENVKLETKLDILDFLRKLHARTDTPESYDVDKLLTLLNACNKK